MGLINGENLESTLENTFNTLNILKYFISLSNENKSTETFVDTDITVIQKGSDTARKEIQAGSDTARKEIQAGANTLSNIRVKNLFSDVKFTDWNAATSLMSKYTFIKDYSNQYIKLIQNTENGNKISSKILLDAANYSSNACVNASEMANSFNLDKGLNSFITMAVFIAIVTVLPFILIWFLLSSNAGAILDATFKKDVYDTSISNIDVQGTKLTQLSKKVDSIMEKIKILNGSPVTGGSKLHKKKKGGGEGEPVKLDEVKLDEVKLDDVKVELKEESKPKTKDEKYLDYVSTLESTVQEIEDIVNSMNDSVNTIQTIREDNDDLQEKIYAAEAAATKADADAAEAEAQKKYDIKTKEIFAKLKVNTYITNAVKILSKINEYLTNNTKTDEIKKINKNISESNGRIQAIKGILEDKLEDKSTVYKKYFINSYNDKYFNKNVQITNVNNVKNSNTSKAINTDTVYTVKDIRVYNNKKGEIELKLKLYDEYEFIGPESEVKFINNDTKNTFIGPESEVKFINNDTKNTFIGSESYEYYDTKYVNKNVRITNVNNVKNSNISKKEINTDTVYTVKDIRLYKNKKGEIELKLKLYDEYEFIGPESEVKFINK